MINVSFGSHGYTLIPELKKLGFPILLIIVVQLAVHLNSMEEGLFVINNLAYLISFFVGKLSTNYQLQYCQQRV